MEGAGVEEGLPEALAAVVRPAALAEYEKTLTAVFSAGAEVLSMPSNHNLLHQYPFNFLAMEAPGRCAQTYLHGEPSCAAGTQKEKGCHAEESPGDF